MKPSKITMLKPLKPPRQYRPLNSLAESYTQARFELQSLEIELHRSKIVVLDGNGNLIKLKLIQEH
jgi:hypothetical protein